MNALGKYRKFIVLFILAVVILWFFGRGLDWSEVWKSLQKANIWLVILATSIICIGYLLRALRWRTLLSPITETSLRELFATTTVGFAAVFLFGRAGEFVRPMWLPMRDKRVRPGAALATIGIERVFDLTAIVVLSSLNLIWYKPPTGHEAELAFIQQIGFIMLGGITLGIISLIIYRFNSERFLVRFEPFLNKIPILPKAINKVILSILKYLAESLKILENGRELATTIFWTASLWLAIALPTWLVIRAFDLQMSFADALFIMSFAVFGSLVPTPGGAAGAFHAATAGGLIFLNVNRDTAAAVSIVMHLVYFAPALIFGFYYFLHGDISWERFRSLAESSPEESIENKTINQNLHDSEINKLQPESQT